MDEEHFPAVERLPYLPQCSSSSADEARICDSKYFTSLGLAKKMSDL